MLNSNIAFLVSLFMSTKWKYVINMDSNDAIYAPHKCVFRLAWIELLKSNISNSYCALLDDICFDFWPYFITHKVQHIFENRNFFQVNYTISKIDYITGIQFYVKFVSLDGNIQILLSISTYMKTSYSYHVFTWHRKTFMDTFQISKLSW